MALDPGKLRAIPAEARASARAVRGAVGEAACRGNPTHRIKADLGTPRRMIGANIALTPPVPGKVSFP